MCALAQCRGRTHQLSGGLSFPTERTAQGRGRFALGPGQGQGCRLGAQPRSMVTLSPQALPGRTGRLWGQS